jgi:predicted ATPase
MTAAGGGFQSSVQLLVERVANVAAHPFCIPAVKALKNRLRLHAGATFFVGENGSGKSTLIEALAIAAGFNAEGGTGNFRFRRARPSPVSTVAFVWREPSAASGQVSSYELKASSTWQLRSKSSIENPVVVPR